MPCSVRYRPNGSFARSVMGGAVARAAVAAKAARVRAAANSMYGASGYGMRVGTRGKRAHAFVYTGDTHSINSNRKHNTLLKALGR